MRSTPSNRPLALLAGLSLSILAACGGDAGTSALDPAGALTKAQDAMQSGDSAGAAKTLEAVFGSLDTADPLYKDGQMLLAQALAEEEPDRAMEVFMGLASKLGESVTPKDYRNVTSYIQTHAHYDQAIEVMNAGLTKWPEDEDMIAVKDKLVAAVKNAGDSAAMEKLKGLGYL